MRPPFAVSGSRASKPNPARSACAAISRRPARASTRSRMPTRPMPRVTVSGLHVRCRRRAWQAPIPTRPRSRRDAGSSVISTSAACACLATLVEPFLHETIERDVGRLVEFPQLSIDRQAGTRPRASRRRHPSTQCSIAAGKAELVQAGRTQAPHDVAHDTSARDRPWRRCVAAASSAVTIAVRTAVAEAHGVDLDRVEALAEFVVQFPREAPPLLLLHCARPRARGRGSRRARRAVGPRRCVAMRARSALLADAPPRVPRQTARQEQQHAGQFVHLVALVRSRPCEHVLEDLESNAQQRKPQRCRRGASGDRVAPP